MTNYELSIKIMKAPELLGLNKRDLELIEQVHLNTGASLGVCYTELIFEKWNVTDASIRILNTTY